MNTILKFFGLGSSNYEQQKGSSNKNWPEGVERELEGLRKDLRVAQENAQTLQHSINQLEHNEDILHKRIDQMVESEKSLRNTLFQQDTSIKQQASQNQSLTQTITQLTHHNSSLHQLVTDLQQQELQLRNEKYQQGKQLESLSNIVTQLQDNIDKLFKENMDLQAETVKLVGNFPSIERIIESYTHFGQQTLVGFISLLDEQAIEPGIANSIVSTIKTKVYDLTSRQYSTILQTLFPSSLSSLAQSNAAITRELSSHLQNNYKVIMDLDTYCNEHQTTIDNILELRHYSLPHDLYAAINEVVRDLHTIFCQIVLTKSLELGEEHAYDKKLYNNPFLAPNPTVVLPFLMVGDKVVAKGFAY